MNSYTILLMHQFLEERSKSSGLEPVEERIVKNMMINENIFIHKILAFYHFKIFIKYINSWMIFLRKQVEKWGCKYSSSLFMSTNKQISSNKKELANPFRNKQYTNIVKLLQTGISQKNQSMFNRLVLQDVLYRMQKADHQLVSSYAEITARDKLINKVFERMLAQLKTLNVEDVCLLVKLYSYSQSNRFCKLTADNKQKYRNQVHFRIKNLIEEDKVGANKEVFKDILYTLFASKKMLYILKDLINYLGQYDMKDNSQLHRLFKEIAPLFKTTYYNDEIEPLIIRYMDPSVNKIDNAKQWVKPIVFDIIKIYNFGHRIEGNPLFAHYLDGLEHVFQRNQLQIGDQILIFRSFLKWSQFESPYLWKIDDIGRCVRLIYSMMKDLQEKLKVNQNLNTQLLIALLQSKNYFETFFGFSYGFLNKSYKQLLSQSNQFCWQMFKVQIIDNYQRFEPEDMVAVVYFNISLPNNLQQQFVEVLIKMLEQAEYKSQIIITRLRIYEHIAKLIKQNNYDSYRMSFQKILRKAEESCSSLRQFQLVRLINIFRVLAIKSNTLQKILQFNMKKKEYTIIENFTRTCLKSHSYPFIFDALESLKHKYQSNSVDVLKNITPVIWSSLKRVKIEMIQSNRDQIFIYWLHTNLDYFQSLTKSSQNCYSVYSNAVKQFYMNSKGIRNSINYQILIELMYSWHKQNHTNSSQFQTLVVQNLKGLIQSTGINQILGFQYRHSFFIKLMWGFLFLNKFAPPEESPIKRIRQIRQAHSIIKSIQLGIYRDKPSIKNLLLLRYSKTFNKFNKVHQIRLKMFLLSLNTWMWSNYHNLHLSEQKHSISSPEFIKFIESKLGKIGHFEYLLYSHNKNIDHQFKSLLHQSEVPSQIVQGTLSSNSQIKQNVLLDLLHYKRTLIYLFKKHPGLAQNFILKIIDIKFPPLGIKLFEAANLVNDIKMYIKAQVINKFKDWIKTTLENYPPSHSGAFAKLWVFFNHSTKQTQSAIRTYVASQLQQGNFYLASIFYLNNYIHFENQVLEFLRIVKANHSIPYLESSDIQLLIVINSMLGLSLNQNSNKVLKYFVQSFLCYIQPQAISQNYKQNKYEVHQLYMLLCVGANRLSAGDNEHQRIEILLHELDDRIPDIRKDCLSKLRVKTMKNLEHFAPKQIESVEMQPQLQLPIIKSKVVILDNEQPGYLRNVQQYIKKTLQVDHQLVFTKQTEFAKLEIVSNQ